MKKQEQEKGITLIALIITIIVMLILVAVTVRTVINSGLFNHAGKASSGYSMHEAREQLGTTLAGAQAEKYINKNYNENEYLDAYILEKLPGAKVVGDIAIVNGWAFNIDRSVPKIADDLGREEDLVYPELKLDKVIDELEESAIIKIQAKEAENGINKIEIILNGKVVKTYTYEDEKEQIEIDYDEVTKNGTYMVKVYSKTSVTGIIEINELAAVVEFSPNGNKNYQKEHSVQVMLNTSKNNIVNMKYQWTETAIEPEANSFVDKVTDGETLVKSGVNGTWYLWVFVETSTGKTSITGSEPYYFDNIVPEVNVKQIRQEERPDVLGFKVNANDLHSGLKSRNSKVSIARFD